MYFKYCPSLHTLSNPGIPGSRPIFRSRNPGIRADLKNTRFINKFRSERVNIIAINCLQGCKKPGFFQK